MAKKLTVSDYLVLAVVLMFSVWAIWFTFRDGSRFYNPFVSV